MAGWSSLRMGVGGDLDGLGSDPRTAAGLRWVVIDDRAMGEGRGGRVGWREDGLGWIQGWG